jgi:hypothetical protein
MKQYIITTSLDFGAPTWLPTDAEDRRHVNIELLQRQTQARN